jgi:hypothetical protein
MSSTCLRHLIQIQIMKLHIIHFLQCPLLSALSLQYLYPRATILNLPTVKGNLSTFVNQIYSFRETGHVIHYQILLLLYNRRVMVCYCMDQLWLKGVDWMLIGKWSIILYLFLKLYIFWYRFNLGLCCFSLLLNNSKNVNVDSSEVSYSSLLLMLVNAIDSLYPAWIFLHFKYV